MVKNFNCKIYITNFVELPSSHPPSYCEKRLKNKTSLAAHERQHTGEKPFPCSICAAGFASNSGLGQHMRGVHKIAARGGQTGWNRKEKQK